MNIAFIGLGNMGSAMATNLSKPDTRSPSITAPRARADALKPLGARVAATPGEAAAGAEIAITMLADDHALESVVFGKGSHSRFASAQRDPRFHEHHQRCALATAGRCAR